MILFARLVSGGGRWGMNFVWDTLILGWYWGTRGWGIIW